MSCKAWHTLLCAHRKRQHALRETDRSILNRDTRAMRFEHHCTVQVSLSHSRKSRQSDVCTALAVVDLPIVLVPTSPSLPSSCARTSKQFSITCFFCAQPWIGRILYRNVRAYSAHIYMNALARTHTCTRYMHISAPFSPTLIMCVCVCVNVCVYIHIYCVCVCIYVCMHVCVYAHMDVHAYVCVPWKTKFIRNEFCGVSCCRTFGARLTVSSGQTPLPKRHGRPDIGFQQWCLATRLVPRVYTCVNVVWACMYVRACVCVCVYTYIYIYIYTYTYVCVYIYIHTHTHIYIYIHTHKCYIRIFMQMVVHLFSRILLLGAVSAHSLECLLIRMLTLSLRTHDFWAKPCMHNTHTHTCMQIWILGGITQTAGGQSVVSNQVNLQRGNLEC